MRNVTSGALGGVTVLFLFVSSLTVQCLLFENVSSFLCLLLQWKYPQERQHLAFTIIYRALRFFPKSRFWWDWVEEKMTQGWWGPYKEKEGGTQRRRTGCRGWSGPGSLVHLLKVRSVFLSNEKHDTGAFSKLPVTICFLLLFLTERTSIFWKLKPSQKVWLYENIFLRQIMRITSPWKWAEVTRGLSRTLVTGSRSRGPELSLAC